MSELELVQRKIYRDILWLEQSTDILSFLGMGPTLAPFSVFYPKFQLDEAQRLQLSFRLAGLIKKRMGRYFEQLAVGYLQFHPDLILISDSLIIKSAKRVIGEADALFWNRRLRSFLHLELACKFFLYVGNKSAEEDKVTYRLERGDLKRFLGMDVKDSLWKKIHYLKTKQLCLFQTKSGIQSLKRKILEPGVDARLAARGFDRKEARGITMQVEAIFNPAFQPNDLVQAESYFCGKVFLPAKSALPYLSQKGFVAKKLAFKQSEQESLNCGFWVPLKELSKKNATTCDILATDNFKAMRLDVFEWFLMGSNDLLTGEASEGQSLQDFLATCKQVIETFDRRGFFFKARSACGMSLFGVAVTEKWISEALEKAS